MRVLSLSPFGGRSVAQIVRMVLSAPAPSYRSAPLGRCTFREELAIQTPVRCCETAGPMHLTHAHRWVKPTEPAIRYFVGPVRTVGNCSVVNGHLC